MTAKSRALALLAGVTFIVSAAPPEIDFAPVPMFTAVPQVKQVMCTGSRGSAFQALERGLVSVNHVTSELGCKVDGVPLEVVYADEKLDYSASRIAPNNNVPLEVDCGGLQVGRQYVAAGYAHGYPIQRAIVVSPSAELLPGLKWDENTIMVGTERFIPGMSGTAVIDAETGKVAGIVKGYNIFPGISYAIDVRKTPLCPASAPQ